MAGTEDIAEKIGDLLLDQASKGAAFAAKAVPSAVGGIALATSNTIKRLREQVKNDKELRRLMGLEGEVSESEMNDAIRKLGLVASTIHVADADAKELAALLDERKVLFARVDKTDDNCKMFVFLTRDAEKVQAAAELMNARRGLVTELRPDLFFNSLHPERVKEVAGLDDVELELFRHYARKDGVVFTTMRTHDEKNNLYFDVKDAESANKLLLRVGWVLSGPQRDKIREQLEHRIKGRRDLYETLEDPQKEMYIVSATNPASYIHITAEEFTQYKNGKSVSKMPREKSGFAERCMAYCDGLEHPVILAPDEFRTDLKATDMSKYPTMDFMAKGFEENREMEKLNDLISLVSRKSGLDNEHDSGQTLWDSSVSFSEFSANENYSDEQERREAEEEYERLQAAAQYPDSRFVMDELNMDQRNLDFIVYRAEQKRRAQSAGPVPEKEQEKGGQYSL